MKKIVVFMFLFVPAAFAQEKAVSADCVHDAKPARADRIDVNNFPNRLMPVETVGKEVENTESGRSKYKKSGACS